MMRLRVQDHAHHLIQEACAAHGGMDTWLRVNAFHGAFRELRGPIPLLKGLGASFESPSAFSVYHHQRRTVFHDYPHPGERTVFDAENGPARMILVARSGVQSCLSDYRQRFLGAAKW